MFQQKSAVRSAPNMMLLPILLGFFCACLTAVDAAGYSSKHWRLETDWSYTGSTGPTHWCKLGYDECCGSMQSPINLVTKHLHHISNNIRMVNYNAPPKRILLKNNADTVRLEFAPKSPKKVATLTFEDLPIKYVLDNVHFHWGSRSRVGSEHTVDGKRFPMEAHFVHRDSKYNTADEASLHLNGVVVMSTFFRITKNGNSKLQGLIRDLKFVQYAEETFNDTSPFSVSKLLPSLRQGSHYFTYKGSFTTPPCTQGVRWIIFKNRVSISEKQMEAFRTLQTRPKQWDPAKNHPLVNNYRPTQSLNNRTVDWCQIPFSWQ